MLLINVLLHLNCVNFAYFDFSHFFWWGGGGGGRGGGGMKGTLLTIEVDF